MDFRDRERLADETDDRQPNLVFSVRVLKHYGATLAKIELVLGQLLVFSPAMKCSAGDWPVIAENMHERCLARLAGRVRFITKVNSQRQTHATMEAARDAVHGHPEQPLLVQVL